MGQSSTFLLIMVLRTDRKSPLGAVSCMH